MRHSAEATVWSVIVAFRKDKNVPELVQHKRLILTECDSGSDLFDTASRLYFNDSTSAAHHDFSVLQSQRLDRAHGAVLAPVVDLKALN